MNYLVTHYKNLAEQLQSRINHLQQCLYEMDAAAGGGIDQLRVDDTQQNYTNVANYQQTPTTNSTTTTSTPTYPTVKGPFQTPESVNPNRWGIEVDDQGNLIVPNPKPPGFDRALKAYFEARRIYLRYVELQNRQRPERT